MRILITAVHYPVASGRYAFNALKRLGHDVHSFGPCTDNQIWGMSVDEAYTWIPDIPPQNWEPELVIHMDGNWIYPERFGDMPHVVYGVDNHVRDYRHGEFDHLFLAHGHGYRMGEEHVTWLPCGYDPQWFTPGPAWGTRPVDAAMIGWMYDNRAELIYALHQHVPHLSIRYGMGAVYEQYAAEYHNARISLCRSYHGDVAQRVFETAAMGCLILTDPLADAEALGLEDGVNCRIYENSMHCVEIIREVQQHARQAAKIAKAGQEWAIPQTWDVRMQVIVEWAQAQDKPKPKKAKAIVESEQDE